MTERTARAGVFFDLDDTLYDHLTPLKDTLTSQLRLPDAFDHREAYQRFRYYSDHLAAAQENAFAAHNVEGQREMRVQRFMLMLQEFGIQVSMEEAKQLQQDYVDRQYDIALFDGARETILRLQQDGYTVGIITNGAEAHQVKKVEALALDMLVPKEHIYITGRVGWDKPDPRIFQHALQETGVDLEHAVYIGDSWRNDVIGALGAGWRMIWFNHRFAARESQHEPHHEAQSYEDISRILFS